jgi:hypothetical protein
MAATVTTPIEEHPCPQVEVSYHGDTSVSYHGDTSADGGGADGRQGTTARL